jgi:hypothetical protein
MVKCVDRTEQPSAPFGGIAHNLIQESRALGCREHPAEYAAMCLDELAAIRSLLTSDDTKLKEIGIAAARAIRKEQRALLDLELKYAKVGIEAGTFDRLSRLRFASESGDRGPSPENVSAGMAKMMGDLMAERKENGDGGS